MTIVKKTRSIKHAMMNRIILFVLLPLAIAIAVLSVLLQTYVERGTKDAFSMMFSQNCQRVENIMLQCNYASSVIVTQSEYSRILSNYQKQNLNDYEKNRLLTRIVSMLTDIEITQIGNFGGEIVLILPDGVKVCSLKAYSEAVQITKERWYPNILATGQVPYWDNEMNSLFGDNDREKYIAFGRTLRKYQKDILGYAFIRIPKNQIFQFGEDDRFQKGDFLIVDENGRLLAAVGNSQSEYDLETILQNTGNGSGSGRFGKYYIMFSNMKYSRNRIIYVGDYQDIFQQNEDLLRSTSLLLIAAIIIIISMIAATASYITAPVLFFANTIDRIEQPDAKELYFTKGKHFQETEALESGIIRAQARIQNLISEVREETEKREQARYEALKAQINPHFLFNTLNAIRWKASLNGDVEVSDILSELGLLLGETYKNDQEFESVEDSIRTLQAYVSVMRVRFGNKVRFFQAIPKELNYYRMPRFCLQPLVENAFIHGMNQSEGGLIVLRAEKEEGNLIFTLVDNGIGLQGKVLDLNKEEEPKKKGITGIGLSNIHHRIQRLYGNEYGLSIDEKVSVGFKISLKIPAEPMNREKEE